MFLLLWPSKLKLLMLWMGLCFCLRMSFPERLTLSHLIDGENEKDSPMSTECLSECGYRRNKPSSSVAAVGSDIGTLSVCQ